MTKVFFILISLFFSGAVFSQNELYSVYFEKEHPLSEKVKNPEQFYGTYRSEENVLSIWEINEKGIIISEFIPLKIPKESVRERSKYTVRNGYIFGVVENDSLEYIDQGEHYLVGVPNEQLQADWKNKETENEVYSNGQNSLYLHYKEGDFFSVVKLTFNGNTISFQEFEYEEETIKDLKKLKKTEETKLNSLATLLINPKSKEWQEFNFEKYFKESFSLQKN